MVEQTHLQRAQSPSAPDLINSQLASKTDLSEGTLELTILKAELSGEPLPAYTQSYVQVTCQG